MIDFDSTFVSVECLDELARLVFQDKSDRQSLTEQISEITRLGMEGEIDFAESLAQRLELLRPSRQELERLTHLLTDLVTPSIVENRQFFDHYAGQIYVISGGFKEFIAPIVGPFGIDEDHVLANSFHFTADGHYTGYDQANPLAQAGGKVKTIHAMELDGPVIIVGDGQADWELRQAGLAKAFVALTENIRRDKVAKKADFVAENFDQVVHYLQQTA